MNASCLVRRFASLRTIATRVAATLVVLLLALPMALGAAPARPPAASTSGSHVSDLPLDA